MKPGPVHILLLLLVLFAVSCKGPKLIPRKELTVIVGEMLVRDQQLKSGRDMRKLGDTTYVYEGIFEAHGYTTDDYIYSIQHYLRDPERFSRVFRDVSANLDKEAARVDREITRRDWNLLYKGIPFTPIDSINLWFYPDTLSMGNVHAAQHPVTREVRFMAREDDSLFRAREFSPILIYIKEHEPDSSEVHLHP